MKTCVHIIYHLDALITLVNKILALERFYCVSNVTFHAESNYAIKMFPSPTVLVQWPF